MTRRLLVAAAAVLGSLMLTGAATASTLGVTAPPTGASQGACFAMIVQATDDASTPYVTPAGGGEITQWQTYTAGDTAGSDLTFAVLRSTGTGTYTAVGVDTVTLPNPLPTNNVASFTLSAPIEVSAGDTLALYSSDSSNTCFYYAGSTPSGDSLYSAGAATLPPTAGETITASGSSGPHYTLNLAATFVPNQQDASVQTSTSPSAAGIGSAAVLGSVVTNGGPMVKPITFVDHVPTGLTVQSASAGYGTCTVSGQTVTCVITNLPVGQSATVDVVVIPGTAGSYANNVSVSVASGISDPSAANNTASATLNVPAPPPTQQCVVPKLPKIPVGAARSLLSELGCTVAVSTKHSGVPKGIVIGLIGTTGTFPYQQKVTLLVSSGPKAKKHKKKH